jgi:putative FmdB family regulatory protein
MPLYDFKCADCSADFEIMAKMSQVENIKAYSC